MLHAAPHSSPSFPTPMTLSRDIRALLLDDNSFDRARISRMCNKTNLSIHLDEVDSIAQLDEAVARENYDLILIDYRLPVGDGIEALDHVMHNELNRNAGKIMITGDGARETAVEAMRGGCHDFLTKEEMDADALRRAMVNALTAAHAHQQMALQTAHQKEIIRQGLVDAIRDTEVQDNVISIVRQQMLQSGLAGLGNMRKFDEDELDALVAAMNAEDDFIFH